MATLVAKMVFKAVDQVSGVTSRMANNILKNHDRINRGLVGRTNRMVRHIGQSMQGIGSYGASFLGAKVIQNGYAFDKQLRFIGANANLAEKKIVSLGDKLAKYALKYPRTRAQIAKGASEFITAGNSVKDLDYSMEPIIKAAIASQQTEGKVAADGTDVLAAYYGAIKDPIAKAKRLNEIFNLMAVGATSANHNWAEQTLAMQYSVPVVQALGLSLEETTAMIGLLADNGFKGEKGGSALRTILLNLNAPTKAASLAFKQLGIDKDKAFKFNAEKAFNASSLTGQLEATYGTIIPAAKSVLTKTLNDNSLQTDMFKMKTVLLHRLANAMNIAPKDLEARSSLRRVIDGHFQGATENFDPNYMFSKLAKANPAQMKAVTGVKRTPQALKLARGFHDQYLPKLAKIKKEKVGALDRRMNIFLRGFSSDIDRMNSSLDNLSHTIEKSGLTRFVGDLAKKAKQAVDWMSTLNPTVLKFAGYALITAAVIAPLGIAISSIGGAAATFMFFAGGMGKSLMGLNGLVVAFGKNRWKSFKKTNELMQTAMSANLDRLVSLRRRYNYVRKNFGDSVSRNMFKKTFFGRMKEGLQNYIGLLSSFSLKKLGSKSMSGLKNMFAGLKNISFKSIAAGIRIVAASVATLGGSFLLLSWPILLAAGAIALIYLNWNKFKKLWEGFSSKWEGSELQLLFQQMGKALGWIGDLIKPVLGWLGDLFGIGSGEDKDGLASWFDLGSAAAERLNQTIRTIKNAIAGIRNLASKAVNWFGGTSPKVPNLPSVASGRNKTRTMPSAPIAATAKSFASGGRNKPRVIPARAKGGETPAGDVLVGERGPEIVHFKQPSTVIPNHKIDRLAKAKAGAKAAAMAGALALTPVAAAAGTGQGNKSVTINAPITITIDGSSGNAQEIAQQVERVLSQKLKASMNAAMHDGGF